MKSPTTTNATEPRPDVRVALEQATERIAPTWPLDRFIAVNPLWGMIDRALPDVAAELGALSGTRLLFSRAEYRREREEGRLRDEHLREAIARRGASTTLDELLARLAADEPVTATRARVVDVIDAERDLEREVSWRDFVTNGISQFCAEHFDEGQASFRPPRDGGLYASWRRSARGDRAPALLMGLESYRALAEDLPESTEQLIDAALRDIAVPADELVRYLHGLLLDVNGWAAWCAYRRWQARLAGTDDDALVDLLAVRLAWEWLLLRSGGKNAHLRWQRAVSNWPRVDDLTHAAQDEDWLFQEALELAWRERVIRALPAGLSTEAPRDIAVQAAFCIDVRSEPFRRALEAQSNAVQTLGFAGFFGLPVEYRPHGTSAARPQLPGLLAPRLRVTDVGLDANDAARRASRLDVAGGWKGLKTGAVSTFTFVEAMGLAYAGRLLLDGLGLARTTPLDDAGLTREAAARRKPRLTETVDGTAVDVGERADLAAGILRAMSLTHDFARLVLLAGHGASMRNNPHAAGYDCGACCGQTGEVNARATAALLNEPAVREGLAARGITVPNDTRFVAGLHDTTTDEVTLLDLDEVPASHAPDVAALRRWLEAEGARAREERKRRLGLAGQHGAGLRRALRARTRDWAQVRPEWGLAGNAAFIVAPREHCRHLDLEGRSFLHDYRFEEDEGFGVLELIMTAPMVVTHWINFQYYASTVDNLRYGSGNKVLHNVVGGHLGVFEGNGGDLRTGLPMQALHDGERWVHTPLRLSVFIEAPRDAIDAILDRHEHVRSLVMNGWIALFQIDAAEAAVNEYREGRWVRPDAPDA